jgi:hypothetical protein
MWEFLIDSSKKAFSNELVKYTFARSAGTHQDDEVFDDPRPMSINPIFSRERKTNGGERLELIQICIRDGVRSNDSFLGSKRLRRFSGATNVMNTHS